MHELGVLRNAVATVSEIAEKNGIRRIQYITLEIGTDSTYVPTFFTKLFPVAIENLPLFQDAQLRMVSAPGRGLIIKEIGYEEDG